MNTKHIINTICEYYEIDFDTLLKHHPRGKDHVVWPRQVIEYCLRRKGMTLLNVSLITKVSHCTILWSCRRVEEEMDINSIRGQEVKTLLKQLKPLSSTELNVNDLINNIINKCNEFTKRMEILTEQLKKITDELNNIRKNIE